MLKGALFYLIYLLNGMLVVIYCFLTNCQIRIDCGFVSVHFVSFKCFGFVFRFVMLQECDTNRFVCSFTAASTVCWCMMCVSHIDFQFSFPSLVSASCKVAFLSLLTVLGWHFTLDRWPLSHGSLRTSPVREDVTQRLRWQIQQG